MKSKLLLFFRIVLTLAIFFAIFKYVPYNKLIEVYQDSNKLYLALGIFIFFLSQVLGIFRWRYLLWALGVDISIKEAFLSYYSGLFFNLFFPSIVAGDVFRGVSISYRHGQSTKAASSVLMDRFSGLTAITLIAAVSFIFSPQELKTKEVGVSLTILVFIALFAFLVIFSRRFFLLTIKVFKEGNILKNKIISFHDKLYFFKQNPKLFIKSLFFSFPIQILIPLGFYAASFAFGVELGVLNFLILVPIVVAISVIPITIAGAGTREASAVFFFALIGIDKSIGLGVSLLNLIFLVVTGILGGIIYVSLYHRWLQRSV